MLAIGRNIGAYRIEQELGRGGMGVVYRARDQRLERDVAIKALPEEVAQDADRLERFRREARTVAQLSHPHIVQIHHLLEHEGRTYLVLELVLGNDLAALMRERRLAPPRALRIAAQIASALEAAHARGVVHRDLKPGNVMVTGDGAAKVLDFGLAVTSGARLGDDDRTIEPGQPAAGFAEAGGIAGTPGYMAPEQARGEAIDHRADLFSFGCMLYEMLAHRPAFDGDNYRACLDATLSTTPDLSVDAPPEVIALVESCLCKDPAQRLTSAAEARHILERALDPAAGPAHSPEAPPANLRTNIRPAADRFIGRAEEMTSLTGALEQARLVTLTGVGGSGKTRLASELGHRLTARYGGGAWMVELAPIETVGLLMQTVANVLGIKEHPPEDALARHLSQHPTLVILDNCEHLLDEARTFAKWLLGATQGARLLATSREPLGVQGERVRRIPPLSIVASATGSSSSGAAAESTLRVALDHRSEQAPTVHSVLASEAGSLFLDRARQVQPTFSLTPENAPAVAWICAQLDGIPLAIELAAARVKVLSPQQIETKLADRFRLLRAGQERPERHQTLRAALDWSYRLLHDSERAALRGLSVFVGGCTLEAATRVLAGPGGDEFETLDLLGVLVDKSLVVAEDRGGVVRYRLLETIRHFALEHLESGPEAGQARMRHLEFFRDLALAFEKQAPTADTAAFERLDQDLENLLAAIRYAAAAPERVRDGLAMCYALRVYWNNRLQNAAATYACELSLGAPGALDFPQEYAKLTYLLGLTQLNRGDLDHAEPTLARAISVADQHDPQTAAAARCTLSWAASGRGDYARAVELAQQAVEIARSLGDRLREAAALYSLGRAQFERSNFSDALEHYERARAIFAEISDAGWVKYLTFRVGVAAQRSGQHERARGEMAEAISSARRAGDTKVVHNVVEEASTLAADLGFADRAARWLGASHRTAVDAGMAGSPTEQKFTQELRERLRGTLGTAGFELAYRQGEALDFDAAATEVESWLNKWAAPDDRTLSNPGPANPA